METRLNQRVSDVRGGESGRAISKALSARDPQIVRFDRGDVPIRAKGSNSHERKKIKKGTETERVARRDAKRPIAGREMVVVIRRAAPRDVN